MTNSDLRRVVRGGVLLPGEAGFDQGAKAWKLTVDQPVAAVVEAADADDVAALVRYARGAGLTVSAQAGGHGASGDVDGAILLRTTRLDNLEVHPERRVARAGAGVTWGQVQTLAAAHGLTGLTGGATTVSVTGYTLGGGLSWFGRKYGVAADSVRSVDVVDADGDQSTVSAESDPELFWALRGGGGDFALVTAVEFDLYPAPALYGGRMLWPAQRAPEVLAAFQELTAQAPRELTLWAGLLGFPGSPPTVAVDAAYLGETEEGQALLRRLDTIGDLISDSRGALKATELGDISGEPVDPVPVLLRAELLTGLDDRAVEILLSTPIDPLVNVQIRQLGGALGEPAPGGARPER